MAFTYSIVDGFSIAFLLILFISTRERSSKLTETRCFRAIVIMTAILLFCDMTGWLLDGQGGEHHRVMLWVVNLMCYIIPAVMCLSWLYYTGLKMNRLSRISPMAWAFIVSPCLFIVVTALLTPWNHWLFYLDEGNVYHRGKLFFLQIVVPFGYLFAAAVWSLMRARLERLHQQRMEYMTLSTFIIFPLIGGILQFSIYGVSLAWPCTALSLMLIYVSMQNQKISLDALTGLNNRGQFDKHLFSCFERADDDVSFALFMLDIDRFKKINDNYGHTAGDAALISAAGILKRSLASSNAFLARYGGDEFAIILYYNSQKQIDALIKRITSESEAVNATEANPYKLVFSIGYVCFDKKRYSHYQDMITAADAQMYIQKRQHNALR